jgi:dipeptidyl aminopeptidase/acylaminoacyl peptidase
VAPARSQHPIHILLGLCLAALPAAAQDSAITRPANRNGDANGKKVLTIDDYTRWRTIDASAISPDGKWVAYGMRFTNVVAPDAKPVITIRNLDTNADVTIPDAINPQFSSDSRWIVYQIETRSPPARPPRQPGDSTAPADTGRARPAGNTPTIRRTELRELATGKTQSWQDVETAQFSPTATHLLLRRRPAGTGQGAGGAGGPGAPGGFGGGGGGGNTVRPTDALLHELATGRSQFLGSVANAEFNRRGDHLAYTVEAAQKDGNGLFLVELATGRFLTLDNDSLSYNRLAWNDPGTGLAVLKGKPVQRMREKANVLVVYPTLRASAVTFDPARDSAAFPRGFVVSDRAPLSWSDDNKRVFFGIQPQSAAPDTGRRKSTDSLANVDVWRAQDERIQSLQMIRADADRNRSFRQAFDLDAARFIRLADSTLVDLDVASDGRWAVGRDPRGYIQDYGRDKADLYRVNTATGERTLMLKGAYVGQHVLGISADGKHFLYWTGDGFRDYDLDAGAWKTIGAGAPSFVNTEWDYTGVKPSYGVSGYSKDGRGVIVQGRYDLWYLPYEGAAKNLTGGAGLKDEIRYRRVRTAPADPMASRAERDPGVVDLSKPITLSATGEWTKKAGFAELSGTSLRPIVYDDAVYTTPQRAAKAEKYLFTRQTFQEFPDLRVSGPAFGAAARISNANPQQAEYKWGRRVLFDFTLKDGTRSQGILALPDDYKEGEKRAMLVTFYEKNSQGLHRYPTPSYLTGMGGIPTGAVSKGYLTMLPDVYFRLGQSHSDMLEAVEAATKKVIELGYVDPKRIAVHGHSYGGEGAAFIATQSKLFAAVGMGAGVTDLTTDFSQSWGWSYQVNAGSGDNAFSYYLDTQGRWGFSPWDKPEVYAFESALTHAPKVSMPVLIMHGTADPTVSFQEGLNFYQALRYNKKTAYLLAYPGEGHGLRGMANRKDLTIRYFQFFDHYLLGAPAPKWMTDGVPFLVKDTVKEPR